MPDHVGGHIDFDQHSMAVRDAGPSKHLAAVQRFGAFWQFDICQPIRQKIHLQWDLGKECAMDVLVKIGGELVQAMRMRNGIAHVESAYAENAQSVEAVSPPGRDQRITKGREAIKAKREDWIAAHKVHELDVDGPYVHPPNRFGVRFEAKVTQKVTGRRMTLREIAIYSVEAEKIVREEFFMLPN